MKEQEQLASPMSQVCSTVDVVVSSYIFYCYELGGLGCSSSVPTVAIIIAYLFYCYELWGVGLF